MFKFKRIILLCAIFFTGCDLPPEEVENIREMLQSQISRGQVYVIHSSTELSYMIKNSEFNRKTEAERENIVGSIEKESLGFLSQYRNYKHIKIYFLGEGTKGIKNPYICQTTLGACQKMKSQGET